MSEVPVHSQSSESRWQLAILPSGHLTWERQSHGRGWLGKGNPELGGLHVLAGAHAIGLAVRGEQLCRGLGVEDVAVVDAFKVVEVERSMRMAMGSDGPSVVIVRGPCPRKERPSGTPLFVDAVACNGCGICFRVGCPAIAKRDGKAYIEPSLCIGESCQLCLEACPRDAIHVVREHETNGESRAC